MKLEIIFKEGHIVGDKFYGSVCFEDPIGGYKKESYGIVVHVDNNTSYTYPWHTVARFKEY